MAPVHAPAMQTGLKKHGKAAWLRYWSVGSPWLNPTTDVELISRLCQAYDEREELRRLVRQMGHVVAVYVRDEDLDENEAEGHELKGEQPSGVVTFPGGKKVDERLEGQPHGGALKRRKRRSGRIQRVWEIKANPAVQQIRKLEELITRMEGLCGFTPSDRSRLGLAEVKAASALDQLIARQAERRAARQARGASTDGTIIDGTATRV